MGCLGIKENRLLQKEVERANASRHVSGEDRSGPVIIRPTFFSNRSKKQTRGSRAGVGRKRWKQDPSLGSRFREPVTRILYVCVCVRERVRVNVGVKVCV